MLYLIKEIINAFYGENLSVEKINVIWLQGQGCTGCTVSLTGATHPSLADLLTGYIPQAANVNLVFHPTIMLPHGKEAVDVLRSAVKGELDPFVLVLEGAIPDEGLAKKTGGFWCMVGEEEGKAITLNEWIDKLCELPLVVAACPTGAISLGKTESGLPTVKIKKDRCMFCGNCYTMCQCTPLADKEGDGVCILAGGKISNRISPPKFSKVIVPWLPNEPPRWPTVVKTVRQIVEAYARDARKYERLGDWAERIGWERFFEETGLEFSWHLIDDYPPTPYFYSSYRTTAQFRW